MKILVTIANFGIKNLGYLRTLIAEYRSMPYEVDLLVLSNIPKDLGPDIQIVVGLPTKDPWSLPFAHKKLFAERMDDYDRFVYSEDDTLITDRNIQAFLKATELLPETEIAGFIRYEVAPDGTKYYSTIHSSHHWDPHSVKTVGEYTFACYTNEHSGSFLLTRDQLKKAIDSGGFLQDAREGRYDMLVTAATDPYTQCGFKKMICISHLDDFCLHHLPNVYLGRIGVLASEADRELKKLRSLNGRGEIRGPLFETEAKLEDTTWNKKFYETCRDDILALVPEDARSVLSVGCGSGSTEARLVSKGARVVGVPLDCVIQVSAEAKGVEIVPPHFDVARKTLSRQKFDCLMFPDILHHLSDPVEILSQFLELLTKNGTVILSVPNFEHLSVWRRRLKGDPIFRGMSAAESYRKYGLHFTTQREIRRWVDQAGLKVVDQYFTVNERFKIPAQLSLGLLNRFLMPKIVIAATRN